MKTTKKILLQSTLVLLLTNVSCNKSDVIPMGDHTFSCYINGELFVPKGSSNVSTTPYNDGLFLVQHDNYYTVQARDYKEFTIYFVIVGWGVGTFSLSESNGFFAPSDPKDRNHAIVKKNGTVYLSKIGSGSVKFIVADKLGEVKATFDFTLYNENDENDIIHITNGQFDD